jgi:hypothetical protein
VVDLPLAHEPEGFWFEVITTSLLVRVLHAAPDAHFKFTVRTAGYENAFISSLCSSGCPYEASLAFSDISERTSNYRCSLLLFVGNAKTIVQISSFLCGALSGTIYTPCTCSCKVPSIFGGVRRTSHKQFTIVILFCSLLGTRQKKRCLLFFVSLFLCYERENNNTDLFCSLILC